MKLLYGTTNHPDTLHFTTGNKSEAISIMREAAQWLIDTDKPMWDMDELTPEQLSNPPDDFIVMWNGGESVATLILSFEDRFFWPDIPEGTSGFIHKLAIKRKYAGSAMAEMLIKHTIQICKSKGMGALRLDCDPHRHGLCALYDRCGFRRKEIETLQTKRFGTIDAAYDESVHAEMGTWNAFTT